MKLLPAFFPHKTASFFHFTHFLNFHLPIWPSLLHTLTSGNRWRHFLGDQTSIFTRGSGWRYIYFNTLRYLRVSTIIIYVYYYTILYSTIILCIVYYNDTIIAIDEFGTLKRLRKDLYYISYNAAFQYWAYLFQLVPSRMYKWR